MSDSPALSPVVSPMVGAAYLIRGLALLTKPGVRFYAVIPLLINITLFALGVWYGLVQFQSLLDWVTGSLPEWAWLQWIRWILIPLFLLTMGVGIFFTFGMMANIIGAPFNSLLAQRVEIHLRGEGIAIGENWGMKELFVRLPALIWSEINKVLYTLLWTIPFLLLFLVPGVNMLAPFLWLLFSAWILAIQYGDIPMGNHDMTGKEVRNRLRQYRTMSLGFGGMTLLMNSLPFINFLVMPTAVAGATILWVERLSRDRNNA